VEIQQLKQSRLPHLDFIHLYLASLWVRATQILVSTDVADEKGAKGMQSV
jgi:hypothetical protein